MAEEVVILRVEFDQTEAIKQAVELSGEMEKLKQAQQELTAAGQQNTAAYQENAALIRSVRTQQSELNKQIDNSVKQFGASKNSIDSATAANALLRKELRGLDLSTAEGIKRQKELVAQIDTNTQFIKKNSDAYVQQKMNVGSYTDSILKAAGGIKVFGVDLNQMRDGFVKLKSGILVAQTQQASFNNIIKASAFGVLIVALTSLIALFTKFQPVVDQVEQVFGGLKATLDVVIGKFINFGQGIKEFFSGNFAEGIDKMRSAFDNLGRDIAKAYNEGAKFVELQQEIEDINRQNIITNSQLNKEIDQLLLKAKNRTLSERERLNLLDQASKKEKEAFENTRKAAQMELDLAQGKYDAAVRNQTLNDEIEDARANAIAKLNNLESESINLQEKIANRRDALIEAEMQKRQKAAQEIENIRKQFAEAEQRAAEERKREADIMRELEVQEYNNAKQEILDAEVRAGIALRQQMTADGIVTQEEQKELDRQLLLNKQVSLEAQLALAKANGENTLALEDQISQGRIAIQTAAAENEKNLTEGLNAVRGAANALLGKNTLASKALAISETTISTYLSATKAYAALVGLVPAGPILAPIAAGAAIATGLANVAKIAGVQIGGAAAGGGEFLTKGPTMLMVGDNPGGVERVTVEPISGRGNTVVDPTGNLIKLAGGGTVIADGGMAISEASAPVNEMISRTMKGYNPVLSLSEFRRVNGELDSVAGISDF